MTPTVPIACGNERMPREIVSATMTMPACHHFMDWYSTPSSICVVIGSTSCPGFSIGEVSSGDTGVSASLARTISTSDVPWSKGLLVVIGAAFGALVELIVVEGSPVMKEN